MQGLHEIGILQLRALARALEVMHHDQGVDFVVLPDHRFHHVLAHAGHRPQPLVAVDDYVPAGSFLRSNDNYRAYLAAVGQGRNQPGLILAITELEPLVFTVQQMKVELHGPPGSNTSLRGTRLTDYFVSQTRRA